MPHPTWIAYGFAVVMVAVSVYCVGRLALASRMHRRNHRDVNIGHVLMGAAMVGMLVPRWKVLPNGAWETVFATLAFWFLATSLRFVARRGLRGSEDDHVHHLSHSLIHMVMACAMLYMYWLGMPISASGDVGPSMSMSGPPAGAGDPGLTFLIIAVLFASAVWQLDSISKLAPAPQFAMSASGGHVSVLEGPDEATWPWLAPRLEAACHIAMCLTMGYMLVLMV